MLSGTLPEDEFAGRDAELADLSARVLLAERGRARNAALYGNRGAGKTELLRQLFGRLFWRQDRVVPFYFAANPALLSANAFARAYLSRFLCQRLAFVRKEQDLLAADGMSLNTLATLAEDRGARWVGELLDAFSRSADDPIEALRIALGAPRYSVLATSMPVAVLIDDVHLLRDLTVAGTVDSGLASLLEEPMTYRKTAYVVAGNAPELQEADVTRTLDGVPVRALDAGTASALVENVLQAHETEGVMPPLLQRRLGGNSRYLATVAAAACVKKKATERDFWNAYVREIMEGTLLRVWTGALKRFLPEAAGRRTALAAAHSIFRAAEPMSGDRIARALGNDRWTDAVQALYLAGYVRGEFGVFRPEDDAVLKDIVAYLYGREVLGRSLHDLEQELLDRLLPQREGPVRFDFVLPKAKESELVAAQCLEQIGKNLGLDQDALGQLQIALIETCINALEHSKSAEQKVAVSVVAGSDELEVAVESEGQEFIVQETGEPAGDRESAKASGRGWGIKLMKRFADEVRFERTVLGTRTVLVKHLAKGAGVPKEDSASRE